MKSIFGWSLPPGCNRLPGEEPEPTQNRCGRCQSFLRFTPDKTEAWEDSYECDGLVRTSEEEYDEATIQILGEEFRDKKFKIYSTPCEHDLGNDAKDHPPHKVVNYAGVTNIYKCKRCGFENKISE